MSGGMPGNSLPPTRASTGDQTKRDQHDTCCAQDFGRNEETQRQRLCANETASVPTGNRRASACAALPSESRYLYPFPDALRSKFVVSAASDPSIFRLSLRSFFTPCRTAQPFPWRLSGPLISVHLFAFNASRRAHP